MCNRLPQLSSPWATVLAASCLLTVTAARGDEQRPLELQGVGIDEKLGNKIDLDLQFTAENGYEVPLRRFFASGKPVILNLVYYSCPMLCNLVLNGQTSMLREIAWTPGNEFQIVTISIDPTENFGLAARKKQFQIESYGREVQGGWHFLTDYKGNVKILADQMGFRYRWDDRTQQFAHSAAIMLLTPDGTVSRYLYGIKFNPRDVRLALTEASQGKLGSTVDKLLLFCFHYDSSARSYVLFARNLMRAGGVLIIFVMGFVLTHLWRRERRMTSPPAQSLVSVK